MKFFLKIKMKVNSYSISFFHDVNSNNLSSVSPKSTDWIEILEKYYKISKDNILNIAEKWIHKMPSKCFCMILASSHKG